MHGNVEPIKPEKPVEPVEPVEPVVKHRTITLTNRAPVQIVEDDWPITAQGACGQDWHGDLGWKIEVRIREYKGKMKYPAYRTIVYATYEFEDDDEDHWQVVRVGRILTTHETIPDLWKHIREVGEELRERIGNEHLRKRVTHAVDGCFAKLPAQSVI